MAKSPNGNAIPLLDARYSQASLLGTGGVGAVYRVRDQILDKDVAIKVLAATDAEAIVRFHQEARTTAKLNHPNILTVFDFGQAKSGELYLVMDYIGGRSLAEILDREGALSPPKAVPIFSQICSGLAHAHASGILHRDIKPSNIMLQESNEGTVAKIVDFGLAKMSRSELSLTASGVCVGSPLYMSPEQIAGTAVDERSDLYSLGCLMFQILTGRAPLQGETVMETFEKHITQVPPSINAVDDKLHFPPELAAVIEKLLEKDPSRRFQSSQDLQAALAAVPMAEADGKTEAARHKPAECNTASGAAFPLKSREIILLCAALAIASLAAYYFVLRRQSEPVVSTAIETIKGKDARADFYEEPFHVSINPRGLSVRAQPACTDADLKHLLRYKAHMLSRINLENRNMTGKGISMFKDSPVIELNLSRTRATDETLDEVRQLKHLEHLFLEDTAITDDGIAKIVVLPIKELVLNGTKITDQALERVSHMESLNLVGIDRCPLVTAKGLRYLWNCKSLRAVMISPSAAVPDKAINELESHFANLRIFAQKTKPRGGSGIPVPKLTQLMGYMKDPEFRRFWHNKNNFNLTDEQVEKISDPRIRSCYADPDFRRFLGSPEGQKYLKDPNSWGEVESFEKDLKWLADPGDLSDTTAR